MCMLTISIKLTPMKRKFFYMIYCFCMLGNAKFFQMPLFFPTVFLNRLAKDFRVFFFFNCCSKGMLTVREMLQWTVKKKLGYRLYYFVRVGVTYHMYCRKIAGKGVKLKSFSCAFVHETS